MKTFLVLMILLNTSFAFAQKLYLKKEYSLYNSTGSYKLTCKFYSNNVEITENTGTASSIRLEPTGHSGAHLSALIYNAGTESLITKPFNICDGGSLWVKAYRFSGTYFTLNKFEDCGPTKKTRNGWASTQLRTIIEHFCPSYMPLVSE